MNKMKLLLLSDANSTHTYRWATELAQKNIDILIFSLSENISDYSKYPTIKIISCNFSANKFNKNNNFLKVKYFKTLFKLKKVIKEFKPDILHSHYASSYGLLGALSGFHPFILSVWGSDVFDFPLKSFIHKAIIKYNLKKADKVLSTSKIMAIETNKYTRKDIEVTPFGISLDTFKPIKVDSLFDEKDIVIGTIKTLEEKYGIEYLIKAFKILQDKYPQLPLKLLLVGGGQLEEKYKKLAKELNIDKNTIFTGKINYTEIPKYHNMLSVSVSVSVSDSESFGVAVVEASACEKPVVVSDAGGLPEVVENNETGFIVPKQNSEKTAEAIEKLILNKNLREQMGKTGRERVLKYFDIKENIKQMVNIYNSFYSHL